jgi:hypothetical protein
MKPGFYVHASNIISGASQTYGPFPGQPFLTYEFLRCDDDSGLGHIFAHREEREGQVGWEHEEPPNVTFGWRRCYETDHSFATERDNDPYWTDLFIETRRFRDEQPWEPNRLPED